MFISILTCLLVICPPLKDGKENFEDDDDLDDSDREFWDELIEEGLIPRPPALQATPHSHHVTDDVTVVSSTSQPHSDSLLCHVTAEPLTDTTTTDSTSDLFSSTCEVSEPLLPIADLVRLSSIKHPARVVISSMNIRYGMMKHVLATCYKENAESYSMNKLEMWRRSNAYV